MRFTPGLALAMSILVAFFIGFLLDEIAWGLIIGAAVGVLIEAFAGSRGRQQANTSDSSPPAGS